MMATAWSIAGGGDGGAHMEIMTILAKVMLDIWLETETYPPLANL
jgi:hypothetical protein